MRSHSILTGLIILVMASGSASAQQKAAKPVTKLADGWVTLGTGGGPRIRQQRSEPANVLVVNDAAYMFDIGAGATHRLDAANVPRDRLRTIFISHQHIDHNADLAPMLMHRWLDGRGDPVEVIGPPGTKAMVDGIASANASTENSPVVQDGKPKPSLAAVSRGRDMPLATPDPVEVYRDANVRVLAVVNCHFHFPAGSLPARVARSYAFRVETATRSYVYTGDTGPCPAVERLAKGADVLLSEVMDPIAMRAVVERGGMANADAFMRHMMEDHLTPEEAGKLGASAGVGRVVLTHLVPGFDDEASVAGYEDGVRRHYSGSVVAAHDLDRY